MTKQYEDRVCVITGATEGIGKRTARELAKMGFSLALVGRNLEKGRAVAAELKSETGNEAIRFYLADLSSLNQVAALAQEIQSTYDHLDVLLNNAGAYFNELQKTPEGLEKTFALNHLAYFQLTNLLLEMLQEGKQGRVVNVASNAHNGFKINFDNLQGIEGYKGWPAYGKSKLANIMFTYELHRRTQGTGITVNCLHPGFVRTQFGHNNSGLSGWLVSGGQKIFAISPEAGSRTSIYLASSPEAEGVSGLYFVKCQPKTSSSASYDTDYQQRLWQASQELIDSVI